MSQVRWILAITLLLVFIGCGGQQQSSEAPEGAEDPAAAAAETGSEPAAAAESAEARKPEPAAASQTPSPAPPPRTPPKAIERAAAPTAEPPPPPRVQTALVPSGTRLEIRLSDPVSSAANESGDTFEAILNSDLEVDGRVLVPRGSIVIGKLSNIKQSGRVEGRATLSMSLSEIRVEDDTYPIRTNTLAFEAEGTEKKDATKIGIGAGIGAVIGAIAGGGKGAAIGAAVGGGAGTATVLATRGREVEFSTEELFSFALRNDLQVKLP
jgi:hypothetical protein